MYVGLWFSVSLAPFSLCFFFLSLFPMLHAHANQEIDMIVQTGEEGKENETGCVRKKERKKTNRPASEQNKHATNTIYRTSHQTVRPAPRTEANEGVNK